MVNGEVGGGEVGGGLQLGGGLQPGEGLQLGGGPPSTLSGILFL